jgi:carbamate kinase
MPRRIFEIRPVKWLLEKGAIVICAGGGGIPTMYLPGTRTLVGAQVVIDKDRASALLARELEADVLVMATDTDAVHLDWGTPAQRPLGRTTPPELERHGFAAGSMGPKVEAACDFVRHTGHRAAIGALQDVEGMVEGTAGTQVLPN